MLRLALWWGYSVLDATRAALGKPELSNDEAQDTREYQRAKKQRSPERRAHAKPRSPSRGLRLRSFGDVMVYQRDEVLRTIRSELIKILRKLRT